MNVNEPTWNSFVAAAPGGSFPQSWEWGQMQEELHVPYWRLVEEDTGNIAGVALVIKRHLPWGKSWLYVPRGPLIAGGAPLWKQIIKLGEQEEAAFIRVEPTTEPREGWQKAVNDVQPRHTLVVDITKPEDALLSEMHQKTRYNIHLAEKHGVTIRFSVDPKDLEHFLRLAREVSGRTAFSFHPDEYYKAMLNVISAGDAAGGPPRAGAAVPPRGGAWQRQDPPPSARAELAIAEHEGDVLAVHILVSFGDTVTYVHGASGSAKRNLMASYLLQWESMKRAKAAGYKRYDFFGVAPTDSPSDHPWSGITKFKAGFGGQRVSYLGAYDYVLDPMWYWLYSTSRRARSLWR